LLKINELFDPLVITNILELKLLSYLGVEPILDRCGKCSTTTNILTLSPDKNGLICRKCRTNEKIVDLKTIKYIRMYYYLDISKISKIEMDNKIKNEIDDFLTNYYHSHTGLYLNSKEFIEDLKKVNIYV
jgi:DNA repair protein RecO (recombination protein O)